MLAVSFQPTKAFVVELYADTEDRPESLSLLARIDRAFDGIPDAGDIPYLGLAEDTEFDLFLVGLDYRIHKMISLIPNVEYVAYRETDGRPAPDDDLIARLTLSVTS